jgi:hypothetical protein
MRQDWKSVLGPNLNPYESVEVLWQANGDGSRIDRMRAPDQTSSTETSDPRFRTIQVFPKDMVGPYEHNPRVELPAQRGKTP